MSDTRKIGLLIKAGRKASAGKLSTGKVAVKKTVRGKSGKVFQQTFYENVVEPEAIPDQNLPEKEQALHILKNWPDTAIKKMKSGDPKLQRLFFKALQPIAMHSYKKHNLQSVGIDFSDAQQEYNIVGYKVAQNYTPINKDGHKAKLSTIVITAMRNKSINLYSKHKRVQTSFADDFATAVVSPINTFTEVAGKIKQDEDDVKTIQRVKELKDAIDATEMYIKHEKDRPPNVTKETKKRHLRMFRLLVKGKSWQDIANDKVLFPNGGNRHAVINVFKRKLEPKVLKEMGTTLNEMKEYANKGLLVKSEQINATFGWAYLYYKLKRMMGEAVNSNIAGKILHSISSARLRVIQELYKRSSTPKAQKLFYRVLRNADLFSLAFLFNVTEHNVKIDNSVDGHKIDDETILLSDKGSLSEVQYCLLTALIHTFIDIYDLEANTDEATDNRGAMKLFPNHTSNQAYILVNVYLMMFKILGYKDNFYKKLQKVRQTPDNSLSDVYHTVFDPNALP